jgi:autotransporter-associated beta strand protein
VVFRTLGTGVSIQLLGNSFIGQNAFTDGPNGTDNGRTQDAFTGVGPDGNSSSELTASARGAILEVRGNITGAGGLTKQGTDTVILSGTNTYAGTTSVANGTLRLGSSTALAQGSNLTTSGRGVLDLAGNNASVGNLTSPSFSTTTAFASNGGFITNSATVTGTLTVNPVAAAASYSGTIQNNIALTKAGANRLTLTGNNTYLGATTVDGGILEITGTLPSTPTVALNAGGTLLLNSASNNLVNTLANVNLAGGSLAIDNARSANTQTFANLNVSAASTLNFGTGDTNLFRFGALTGLTAPVSVRNWTGSVYATGTTADSGAATQDRIRFTTNPGGAPGTALNGFVFLDASGTSIGRGMVVTDTGGTFGVVPANIATAYWKGDLGSKAWNLGNWSSDLAGTTVSGFAPTGSTDVIISATGQDGQDVMILGEDMQVKSLTVNNENPGTAVNLQSTGGYTLTVVDAAAITVASGAAATTISTPVAFSAATATVAVNSTNGLTLGGAVSGGALTKTGAGTLVLSGNNTYTGLTTVSAGALRATHANALGTTGAGTTVSTGAVLELDGGITTAAEPLVLEGTGLSNDGALRSVSGNNTFAGAVTLNTDSQIQSDADTLTLGGAISGTNRNLTFSGDGNTTVSNAAGISIGSGDLVKEGAGVLSFNASTSSSVGSTTVNGGDLIVNGALTNTKSGTNVTVGALAFLGGDGGSITGTTLIDGGLSTGTETQSFEAGSLSFTGDVTFGAGSFWFIDLVQGNGSTASDSISITGALNITPGAALSFATQNAFTQTEQFTIATFTGGRTGEFTFDGSLWLNGEERTIGSNQYLITYGTGSITLTAVPEPGTLGLLGLALGGFFFRRLRKRREVVAAVVESREENR